MSWHMKLLFLPEAVKLGIIVYLVGSMSNLLWGKYLRTLYRCTDNNNNRLKEAKSKDFFIIISITNQVAPLQY